MCGVCMVRMCVLCVYMLCVICVLCMCVVCMRMFAVCVGGYGMDVWMVVYVRLYGVACVCASQKTASSPSLPSILFKVFCSLLHAPG